MEFAKLLLGCIVATTTSLVLAQEARQSDKNAPGRDCTTDPRCNRTLSILNDIAKSAHGLTDLFVNTYSKPTKNEISLVSTGLCSEFDYPSFAIQPSALLDEVSWLRSELEMQVPTFKDIASDLTQLGRPDFSGLPGLPGPARLQRSDRSTMGQVCRFCKRKGCSISADWLELIFRGASNEFSAALLINSHAVQLWTVFGLWDKNVRKIEQILNKMDYSMARQQDREYIDELKAEGTEAGDFLGSISIEVDLEILLEQWLAHVDHFRAQEDSSERTQVAARLACFFQSPPAKTSILTSVPDLVSRFLLPRVD